MSACSDDIGDGEYGFDLTAAAITYNPINDSYSFQANSTGPHAGWDAGITFFVGDWQYGISGGHYPDGHIDNWFFDTSTVENTFLPDDAWDDGRFAVLIPAEWMPDLEPAAFDWDVSVTVAGEDIDLCEVEAFGTTGTPP